MLYNSLAKLSEREKTIICLRFGLKLEPEQNSAIKKFQRVHRIEEGKELTQKEVASMLGISQSYISRLEKKIMKQLKREMMKEY